jgi:putative transposase
MVDPKRKTLKHFNEPYHAHELTFSCFRKYPLLLQDQARLWALEAFESARKKHNYSILAFVIMPDHVHLIVFPWDEQYRISWFLKSVKQSVSKNAAHWFKKNDPDWHDRLLTKDKKGGEVFRFWQAGGGYDRNITDKDTLIRMIDYIHGNPVRKGLVSNPLDWKWSSLSQVVTGRYEITKVDALPW